MVSFSIIILTHGREELLMKCLRSLCPEGMEWQLILVANGKPLAPSILDFARTVTPDFKLIETEKKVGPGKGRNLALATASGEWVFFIDDDAYVLKDYWEKVQSFLSDKKIDVIGGPDAPADDMSGFSQSLALALSSPLCTGRTFYRHKSFGSKARLADEEKLTSCNLWVRKSALGGVAFPEDYIRAEENFFLQRLKNNGASIYYHPGLVVRHFRRTKLKEIWRPTFYAGYSRSKLMREKLTVGDEIFWLPSLFVMLHSLILFDPLTFWYLARLYLSIILMASIALTMRVQRLRYFPLVTFFHYYIVFVFGVGFLAERIRRKT